MVSATGEQSEVAPRGPVGRKRAGGLALPVPPAGGPPLAAGLGFRLSRLTRTLRATWASELAAHELTPPEAAVLRAVADRPGCSLRALARTLGAEPMRAKRCVDELESRKLLASDHDGGARRSRALRLTPDGARLAATVSELVRHQEERLDGALGAPSRRALEAALAALEVHLDLPPAPTRPPEPSLATTGAPGPRPAAPAAAGAGSAPDQPSAPDKEAP